MLRPGADVPPYPLLLHHCLTVLDDQWIEWLLNTCSEISCGQPVVKRTNSEEERKTWKIHKISKRSKTCFLLRTMVCVVINQWHHAHLRTVSVPTCGCRHIVWDDLQPKVWILSGRNIAFLAEKQGSGRFLLIWFRNIAIFSYTTIILCQAFFPSQSLFQLDNRDLVERKTISNPNPNEFWIFHLIGI